MTLAITTPHVVQELESAERILSAWRDKLNGGIPGDDFPAGEAAADLFARQLSAELLLVAGKCQSLALILAER